MMIMTRTRSIKIFVRFFLIAGLFGFIIFYSFFRSKSISEGVLLSVSGIENGQTFEEEVLRIDGRAERAKYISINGREILLDEESNFKEIIVLSPGYNIITIKALDRFKKEKNEVYEIYYQTKLI